LWGIVASIERSSPELDARLHSRALGQSSDWWRSWWAGGRAIKAEYAPTPAFSLGAFPSVTLRRWLRRRAAKIIGLEEVEAAAPEPTWAAIQGIDAGLVGAARRSGRGSPTLLPTPILPALVAHQHPLAPPTRSDRSSHPCRLSRQPYREGARHGHTRRHRKWPCSPKDKSSLTWTSPIRIERRPDGARDLRIPWAARRRDAHDDPEPDEDGAS